MSRKIIDKIRSLLQQQPPLSDTGQQQSSSSSSRPPFFSLEFFPPKTDVGVENLNLRIDHMVSLHQPIFIDVTWGAGGSTRDLTMAISEYAQTFLGVDVMMHLTCTNMTIEDLSEVLKAARAAGIQNILALRGDPPKGVAQWEPVPGGCQSAIDLVKLIRKEHGDYFGIAVAGFPEGHPHADIHGEKAVRNDEIMHLKAKIDAGADFILTQFFYEPTVFVEFLSTCKEAGIDCPILPGMMPIQSYSSFQRMTQFCRTKVPERVWQDLAPIKDDDEAVKEYGVKLCVEMCKTLLSAGVRGFHFYTLNLEKSVLAVLKELNVSESSAARRPLPWRAPRTTNKEKDSAACGPGSGTNGGTSTRAPSHNQTEDVRPINWANRTKSYIRRTVAWDEFPNGRWGDGRSPAFGELSDSHFFRPSEGSKEDRLAMWGDAPITHEDVYEVFARYVEGKIPLLPWSETPLQPETLTVSQSIAALNRAGFLSINSQPAVNGEKSDHPVFGWGGDGGRVYQKAYLEFFTSADNFKLVVELVNRHPNLVYHSVDSSGKIASSGPKGVTALTWGVFPNKEILQPTIFDTDTFLVWSQEAFKLWTEAWAALYDDETDSAALLYEIHDTFLLVAIIDNDFVESSLFSVFQDFIQQKK